MYRVQDAVDAGFPGARTVIRTYREVWKTRKTGKKDKYGRDVRKLVGKPTKEVAWHVSSLDPDSLSAEELAGCPEGSPRHGRRASRALTGRDCGQGILSRTLRLAGQGHFSETSGWKRKEPVYQMRTPWGKSGC